MVFFHDFRQIVRISDDDYQLPSPLRFQITLQFAGRNDFNILHHYSRSLDAFLIRIRNLPNLKTSIKYESLNSGFQTIVNFRQR